MQKLLSDVLKEAGDKARKQDKIEVLQKNSGPDLKMVLGYAYDPAVKWLLPEGAPPYTPQKKDSGEYVDLRTTIKKIYMFVEGPTEEQRTLKPVRREKMFIDMLEMLDPDDAILLIGMKERKLPYRGITSKLVAEAFPNLAKNWKI